jgi:hypothetical protein
MMMMERDLLSDQSRKKKKTKKEPAAYLFIFLCEWDVVVSSIHIGYIHPFLFGRL